MPHPLAVSLTIPAGYLRWRSIRTATGPRTQGANVTTTTQVLSGVPRLGVESFRYTRTGDVRDDDPVPASLTLTEEQIEAREDLDFYLDQCRREREWEAAFCREWLPRLRRLGLVKCRLPGLPTGEGKPCTCSTCRAARSTTT